MLTRLHFRRLAILTEPIILSQWGSTISFQWDERISLELAPANSAPANPVLLPHSVAGDEMLAFGPFICCCSPKRHSLGEVYSPITKTACDPMLRRPLPLFSAAYKRNADDCMVPWSTFWWLLIEKWQLCNF